MVREINIWLNHNPYKDFKQAKPYSDAILQQLLQNALNTSEQLEIKKNENGKPYVDQPVFFSHSNCRQLYAYVIATDHEVGIDVEYHQKDREILKLAQRYFHPEEYQSLCAKAESDRFGYFYTLWTQKEAWCKLNGGNLWSYLKREPGSEAGLSFSHTSLVDQFSVAFATPKKIDKIRINSIGNQ